MRRSFAILYHDSISDENGDLLFSETEALGICSGQFGRTSYVPSTGQLCGPDGRPTNMYVMAKVDPANNDDGAEFVPPPPNAFDEVDDLSWSVSLTARDLVILALTAVNVVMTIIWCSLCAKSKRSGVYRVKKYQPVSVDSEMDQLHV